MNNIDKNNICNSLIFLNIKELIAICIKFNLPYHIYIQNNNSIIKINQKDNKEILIKRIKYFLLYNKKLSKTLYTNKIIKYDIDNINENTFVYYGLYKTNINILNLMKQLTDNKFKFGAISQKIIRNIWRNNKLITFHTFANLWLEENIKGLDDFYELAYNNFMKKYGSRKLWFDNKKKILEIFKKYNLL